jgi:hypothetical protein
MRSLQEETVKLLSGKASPLTKTEKRRERKSPLSQARLTDELNDE